MTLRTCVWKEEKYTLKANKTCFIAARADVLYVPELMPTFSGIYIKMKTKEKFDLHSWFSNLIPVRILHECSEEGLHFYTCVCSPEEVVLQP